MKTNAKRWTRWLLFTISMSMPIALCLSLFFNFSKRGHNAASPASAAFAPLTEPNETLFPAGTAYPNAAPGSFGQHDVEGFAAPTSNENIASTGSPQDINASQLHLDPVPEPSCTLMMLGSGAMLLMRYRRRPAR
jgi:hypothetical protein